MTRAARIGIFVWISITGLIVAVAGWTYCRHGLEGFDYFIQDSPYTLQSITLLSVAITWLLAGFLLWQLQGGRIETGNSWTWAGFYSVAFLYMNVLRERFRYGDISYYTDAARSLYLNQPLPDTYLYPPLWANLLEFLVPYGDETILVAAWLMNVASLFLFYFLLHLTLERYNFSKRLAALVTTAFMLVNMPLLRSLFYVQVNFHLINLVLLSLLWFTSRTYLSALAMAAAIHLKSSPVVLVPAFLLNRRWKWTSLLAVNLVLLASLTILTHGPDPFLDFIRNFSNLNAPRILSFHDSSFDSVLGTTLSFFKVDYSVVQIVVMLAKLLTAIAVLILMIRSIRHKPFLGVQADQSDLLFNAIPSLFILMVIASPLVWEHHGIMLSLPFLIMLKRLQYPSEWIWFGTAYFLQFFLPTFDFYPWSYARFAAPLILLGLMWKTMDQLEDGTWFTRINNSVDQKVPA
ncbi:MAG: hypothetical protein A2Y54_06550 [Chloroflexi bacterium RBG_16_51_16]|nr:MAG: hypothetical protein A2Y54_06550 [Chloroflexi bacterium RBG_16_51_16]